MTNLGSMLRNDAWWRDAVIYQVYPRSFADSDGDGMGDLPGITGRLPHLEELGVDAVWLSPFYPSPQHDHGYDVSDYRAVEPVYGDLGDADKLIAEAHDLGLKVIVDLVPNHTSSDHVWFQAALGAAGPSRNMYRSRSGLPGPAARAAWNQACSLEVWLGTRSTMNFRPRLWASAISLSASPRSPKRGSTPR